MRIKIGLLILLWMGLSNANAQEWQLSDYNQYTHHNFRDNPLFHESINFDQIDYPRAHAAIFFVTNETRVKHGKVPLAYFTQLEQAAWGHAQRMVDADFFSHNDPNRQRSDAQKRAKLAGITNPRVAENILLSFGIQYEAGRIIYTLDEQRGLISYTANGDPIPPHTYVSLAEEFLKQWMESPGHRANILSDQAVQLGCGIAFYRDASFKNIARFKATQKFQWYQLAVA